MARRLAIALAWLVMWQLGAQLVGSELLLASPLATLDRLLKLGSTSTFWLVVANSLVRILMGFLAGFACALALGVLAHHHPLVAEFLRPPVAALRGAPIVCVIVLLLLWLGSRGVSAAASFLVAFPAIYFAVLEGLAAADVRIGEMLQVFRVPLACRVLAHGWPSLVPYLMAASKSALGMAWKAGVAAELVGAPMGTIGERVYQAKLLLETADVFAWTFAVIVLSAACTHAFAWLLKQSALRAPVAAVRLAGHRGVPRERVPARPIVLDDVSAGYADGAVWEHVSLACGVGERVALMDASGAGKTTLLGIIAGVMRPLGGTVSAGPVSVVFQEVRLIESLSCIDNVLLVCGGIGHDELLDDFSQVLPDVDPTALASSLSGGQRRRVELIRALLAPSSAVLLDEPFASLDVASRRACLQLVDRLLAERPLIVATHDAYDLQLLSAQPFTLQAAHDPQGVVSHG